MPPPRPLKVTIIMKLSLALAFVLGLFAPCVESFVSGGGSAAAHHARSFGIAAKTASAQGVSSRGVAETLRVGGAKRWGGSNLAMSVAIRSDFNLPIGIAAVGLAITGTGNLGVGFPLTLAGLALAFQATRVVFEFDDEAMEVKIGKETGELESSGENAFVGGDSRWNYDTWTNWEVYPSESFPVLMYFKETQTKPEGQIHFFPFIMEPEALLSQVRARVPQVAK